MRLVTHTRINKRYFEAGSAPSKSQWRESILIGEINGKVGMNKVWIDLDDFLSRDCFDITKTSTDGIQDLLDG